MTRHMISHPLKSGFSDHDGIEISFHQPTDTGIKISAEAIAFGQVGKHSEVHRLAWAVCRGKRTPDHIVTLDEFLDAV